jgi:FlgD Ig-like domain
MMVVARLIQPGSLTDEGPARSDYTRRAVARFLPTLLVLALLGSTAAAFAVTEGLKLEKSPITSTQVDKVVSPAEHVLIEFDLRKGDRVSVAIVDAADDVVRSLATDRRARAGAQRFLWDGRDDSGRFVPDGTYRPRVHLAREHRTIVLPNPIRADSTRPAIRLVSLTPRVFSPDGDFRREFVRIRYEASERSRAILYVNGARRLLVRAFVRAGKLEWRGRAVRRLRSGLYRLQLRALDLAGNLGPPTRAFVVRVRYVEVRPHFLAVRVGARFGFRVLTDAKRYSWHLGSRGGVAHGRFLILTAPTPGSYLLRVAANGHVARARVLVRPAS